MNKKLFATALDDWAEGCIQVNNLPWLVYISTTNHCNNKCVVCAHPKVMRKERGIMNYELFKKIVDQLPDSVKKSVFI